MVQKGSMGQRVKHITDVQEEADVRKLREAALATLGGEIKSIARALKREKGADLNRSKWDEKW